MQQQQQQPLGMGLDPATALPTTDTIQAVSEGDVLISLFFFPSAASRAAAACTAA
jgi:hypothetical protein